MRALSLGMVLAAALCAGCAGWPPYAVDRAADLVDCFSLEAGYGGAVDAEVRATDWIATGAGAASSFRWGFAGRKLVGFPGAPDSGVTHHYGVPVMPFRTWLSLEPYDRDGLIRFFYTDVSVRDERFFSPSVRPARVSKSIVLFDVTSLGQFREPPGERKLIDAFDLHAGATFLLSARAGIRPGQIADFVLGWFGIDVADDDAAPRTEPAPPKPRPAKRAGNRLEARPPAR